MQHPHPMSRTTLLPQEILLHIVKLSDVNLHKKLLFIRPFHEAVLKAHYAKVEAHALLYNVKSEAELRMWIFDLSTKASAGRQNTKQLHVHVHWHERHLQLVTFERLACSVGPHCIEFIENYCDNRSKENYRQEKK